MVCISYQLYLSHIYYDLEELIGNHNGDGEAQRGDAAACHRGEQRVVQDHTGMTNHWSFLFLH